MKPIDESELDHQLDDYRLRRQKNNESVRKSREKNRAKLQECADKVLDLQSENTKLNKQLDTLQNELFTLKGLFQHCFSFNLNNLSIKPSEIPTSTLYKMIMKKEVSTGSLQALQSSGLRVNSGFAAVASSTSSAGNMTAPNSTLASSSSNQSMDISFNEEDEFYINQIKSALQNIVRTESFSKIAMQSSAAAVIADSPVTSPGQSIPSSDSENVVTFDLNDDEDGQQQQHQLQHRHQQQATSSLMKEQQRFAALKQQQQQQKQTPKQQQQAQLNFVTMN